MPLIRQHLSQLARVRADTCPVPPDIPVTDLSANSVDILATAAGCTPQTWQGAGAYQLTSPPEFAVHALRYISIPWLLWVPDWVPSLRVLRALVIRVGFGPGPRDINFTQLFTSLPPKLEYLSITRFTGDLDESLALSKGFAVDRELVCLRKVAVSGYDIRQAFLHSLAAVAPNLTDLEICDDAHFEGAVTYPFPHLKHLTRLERGVNGSDAPGDLLTLRIYNFQRLPPIRVHTLQIALNGYTNRNLQRVFDEATLHDVRVVVLLRHVDAWESVSAGHVRTGPWRLMHAEPTPGSRQNYDLVFSRGERDYMRYAFYDYTVAQY